MGRNAEPIHLSQEQLDALTAMEHEYSKAGKPRWADRCRAVKLRAEGYGIDEISTILHRPYRSIQDWCKLFRQKGLRGMTPKTSTRGRPKKLDDHGRILLARVISRGPRAAGFNGSVWTSPMVSEYIQQRWNIVYHPGHVRRLLHQLGFSVQFPRERLALADHKAQDRWLKRTYPRIKKKPSSGEQR